MPNTALLRRAFEGTVGLVLGSLVAVVETPFFLLAVPLQAVPVLRPFVHASARRLATADRGRVNRYLGTGPAVDADFTGERALRFLCLRSPVGLLGMSIFVLILWGAASGALMLWQMLNGEAIGGDPAETMGWSDPIVVVGLGAMLAFVAVWGLIGVARLEGMLIRYYLGPSEEELLRERVSELATTRAGVVEAVNQERRRIERDLHDGVQQRLVALGLLLGRARRATDPDRLHELMRLAHEEAQQSLADLRDVTWRVYPTALDEGGLHPALETVAERSSVPVRLVYELPDRPDLATETVAYFVVSEAVTNAIKHGAPNRIDIGVRQSGSWLEVRVCDDGRGGAQPTGTGLSGLARRVAAADGELDVVSPTGGPTAVTARLPCA
ncbi:sensor histidine kinase [Actinophytocola gossypii]|uniref:histidine kinase n=1 Tax=Actinophytocola gossypii TaxID=2812003 RepID=A0ABT2JB29_9PSEU|nr:histidine kinase [Actinophytocola gossypii]MCT2585050.1 sensor histidine kinase [Actinophytocola gossypii]